MIKALDKDITKLFKHAFDERVWHFNWTVMEVNQANGNVSLHKRNSNTGNFQATKEDIITGETN